MKIFRILIIITFFQILSINIIYGQTRDNEIIEDISGDKMWGTVTDILIQINKGDMLFGIPYYDKNINLSVMLTYFLIKNTREAIQNLEKIEINTAYINNLISEEGKNIKFTIGGRRYDYSMHFKRKGSTQFKYKNYTSNFANKNDAELDKYYNWLKFINNIYTRFNQYSEGSSEKPIKKTPGYAAVKDFWRNYLTETTVKMLVTGSIQNTENETLNTTHCEINFDITFKHGYLDLLLPPFDFNILGRGNELENFDEESIETNIGIAVSDFFGYLISYLKTH